MHRSSHSENSRLGRRIQNNCPSLERKFEKERKGGLKFFGAVISMVTVAPRLLMMIGWK